MEPSNEEASTSTTSSAAIPVAIVLGFAMIALAIFFTSNKPTAPVASGPTEEQTLAGTENQPRPVDETDYILGNPNAQILMIEYSDYDCPFCQQYHNTMHQIMDEYGVTGKVAWVYRQFPLTDLHPNSPVISEAALCVGDIGGNDAFWSFTDLIYSKRNVTDPTNITKLTEYATKSGVSEAEYISCMESGRMEQRVLDSIEDAFNSGARGTPYTVITVGSEQAVIDSAQSYESVKLVVQNLLDQLEGRMDVDEYDPTTLDALEIEESTETE
jgi:protein-disulfide isomerase